MWKEVLYIRTLQFAQPKCNIKIFIIRRCRENFPPKRLPHIIIAKISLSLPRRQTHTYIYTLTQSVRDVNQRQKPFALTQCGTTPYSFSVARRRPRCFVLHTEQKERRPPHVLCALRVYCVRDSSFPTLVHQHLVARIIF
jgi:hypothetical protein